MKTGRTITELAQEIERQRTAKLDLVAPTAAMEMMLTSEFEPLFVVHDRVNKRDHEWKVNGVGHEQLAEHLRIPRQYYERLVKEKPPLLCENVNTWLKEDGGNRMCRSLDKTLRAFRSDKFRALDNWDLLNAALEPLHNSGAEIVSCEVTDRRFYLKAVHKDAQREIQRQTGHRIGDGSHAFFKDIVCPALTLTNSEVGLGSLNVNASVWTEGCTNFAVWKDHSVKKMHVGGRSDLGEYDPALLSDKTQALKNAALWSEVRDVVHSAFEAAKFEARVKRLTDMTKQKITGDPAVVVEVTRKHFGMSEGEAGSLMRHLIQGGDLTRYGLFNAVTRTAEDLGDYDRASEFERMGGEVVELAPAEWKRLAEAA